MEHCGLIQSEEVPAAQDDEAAARRILTLAMPDRLQSVRGIRIGNLINVRMVQLRQALYMAADYLLVQARSRPARRALPFSPCSLPRSTTTGRATGLSLCYSCGGLLLECRTPPFQSVQETDAGYVTIRQSAAMNHCVLRVCTCVRRDRRRTRMHHVCQHSCPISAVEVEKPHTGACAAKPPG